jgi:nicotinamide-nucleotide amidase
VSDQAAELRADANERRIDDAARWLGTLLERSQRSIAIAESLTGGLLVQALARQQGSGEWLTGGLVAYQRSVKHAVLDVSVGKVVSSEAAEQMAAAIRRRLRSDVGLAVTGVGGPDPQDGEPPGTVWIAVDIGGGSVSRLVETELDDATLICQLAVIESLLFAVRALEA